MRAWLLACLCALALGAQTPDLSGQIQEAALAFAQAQSASLGGTRSFRVLRPPNLPRLPENTVRFEASHASKQDFAGPFFVVFRLFADQRPAGTARVDLEGRWVGTLVRARTALSRKTVPSADQIEDVPFEGLPPAGALSEFPSGYEVRMPVAAGKILCRSDIQPIPVVGVGDPVRLELVCGSLVVSSQSIARTAGGLGDRVRLELPNARRSVTAIVTGPGAARIQWAPSGI